MRLSDYETAAGFFMGAHRIDSQRVSLRLSMRDLRRRIQTGPWRNKKRTRLDRGAVAAAGCPVKSEQQKPQQDYGSMPSAAKKARYPHQA